MALEDTVIATENQIIGMYGKNDASSHYSNLMELGLLPLTVKTFATDEGMAFLSWATWVYMSGSISRMRKSNSFVPTVCSNPELLKKLKEEYLSGIGIDFRVVRNKNAANSARLESRSGNGSFGRLMIAMGIPVPPHESDEMATKPHYDSKLPHYFMEIARSKPNPREINEKKHILDALLEIFVTDRLKFSDGIGAGTPYLNLNYRTSRKASRKYAESVIEFLNLAVPLRNPNRFSGQDVVVYPHRKKELFGARLTLSGSQLEYLPAALPDLKPVS